jgi:hypothetical protein
MTTLYRIKHTPSGMYFCPSREVKIKLADGSIYQQNGFYVKSNLSKNGKIYVRWPRLGQIGSSYYTHLITSVKQLNQGIGNYTLNPVLESEWQIEQIVAPTAPNGA